MCQKRVRPVFVAVGLLACFGCVRAEEAAETEHNHEGVHCLRLNAIKRSEVVDNRHIVFEMRNGDLYLNTLARACPGLSRNNAFMYRTSLSELCDLDTITVLDNIGFGLRPGVSCGLALFVPIEKEELDGLKKAIKDARLE